MSIFSFVMYYIEYFLGNLTLFWFICYTAKNKWNVWNTSPIHNDMFVKNLTQHQYTMTFKTKTITPSINQNIYYRNVTHHRDSIEKFYRKAADIWVIRHIGEKCRTCMLHRQWVGHQSVTSLGIELLSQLKKSVLLLFTIPLCGSSL